MTANTTKTIEPVGAEFSVNQKGLLLRDCTYPSQEEIIAARLEMTDPAAHSYHVAKEARSMLTNG